MSYPLSAIAGIGPAMTARLKALGIRTTEKLLEAAKTAKDRKALAEKLEYRRTACAALGESR